MSAPADEREPAHLRRAEIILARLRWLGMAAWLAVLLRGIDSPVDPRIVYGIWGACVLYTAAAHVLAHRGRSIRATAIATTAGDATITALICLVTGGLGSDFYPYFYFTVPATSMRFGTRETFVVFAYNALLSALVWAAAPGATYPAGDLALRVFYLFFLAFIGSVLSREVRENYRLAVQERDRGRALLWRLIRAEEEERKRVAGELHDRMGRQLFELTWGIDRAQEAVATESGDTARRLAGRLTSLGDQARACSAEIRAMMNELRPTVLDDFGFREALREYAAAIAEQGELTVALDLDDDARIPRPEVNVTLFRILQEAVVNVRRHAGARRLTIEFRGTAADRLRLVVRDDGRGFDLATLGRGRYGLLYMRERAEACGGTLDIRSALGAGTEVAVTVPAV